MYGKSANKDPAKHREEIKKQKREQVANLLINKFRNKYMISSVKDKELNEIIITEVRAMLSGGSAHEASLFNLDMKLEQMIKDFRDPKKSSR